MAGATMEPQAEPLQLPPRETFRRILVVGCSATKHPAAPNQLVAAWDLYDGPAYRLMKALVRDGIFPGDVGVWILSAEHGLIKRLYRITTYNRLMDMRRAADLAEPTRARLRHVLDRNDARELYVFAGKNYRHCLRLLSLHLERPQLKIGFASGGFGVQLQQLRTWLLAGGEPQLPL